MISHNHKAIFIHIPKAAGTSIETYFLDDLGLDFEDKHSLILGRTTNLYAAPKVLSHLTAIQMLEQHYISQELFDSYFKFSIVRYPIDRLFSTYKYWGYAAVISFNTFITKQLPRLYRSEKHHFFLKPQTEFLYDVSGQQNLMDFTGRLENLQDDFKNILKLLGKEATPLKHVNKGKEYGLLRGAKKIMDNPYLLTSISLAKHRSKDLSNVALQIILDYYHKDFENFNYPIPKN